MGRDDDGLDSGAWRRHMRPICSVLIGLITVSAMAVVAVEIYDQAYIAAGVNAGLLVVTGLLGGIGVLMRRKGLLIAYAVMAVLWAAFALFHMVVILNLVSISGFSTNPAFVGSADASYIAATPSASATTSTRVVPPATTSSFATSIASRTSPATATAVATTALIENSSASLLSFVTDSTVSSSLAADTAVSVATTTAIVGQRRDPLPSTETGTALATTAAFGTVSLTGSTFSSATQTPSPISTPTTTYLVAILYGIQVLLTVFSCISALLVQTAVAPNSYNTMQMDERYDPPPPSRGTVFVAGGKGGDEYGYRAFDEWRGGATGPLGAPFDPVAPSPAEARIQPPVVDIFAPSTVSHTAAEPVDILAPSTNNRTPPGPTSFTPALSAVSISPTRPPRQARGGQSAAAIAAAAAAGAAPKKYQAGPHNAPAAVPVMRNQSVYSVYTVASDKQRDSDTSRLAGDEESNVSSISTAPVITHVASSGNPNGRGRVVGSTGMELSRSDSGKEPKVRCKYCNEKMPLSQSSSHVCPVKDVVQNSAVPEIAPMKKIDGPLVRRERSQSIVASRSRSTEREATPQEKLDGKLVKAVKRFAPQMDDELAMEVGDTILVEASFEDNWAVGTNQVTDEYGAFPLHCVSRSAQSGMKRVQSIYGAANARSHRR
ncbi:hypothetical protein BC830DRAFT_1101028 [Chytriomyces sp. MP71]|nr:hypothetical protein BC830DRAFT_1101028 [Chytriomyces sp. MP71]